MKFAEVVRSSEAVRTLFDRMPVHRWWWRAILSLHGKPCRDDLSEDERKQILSKGFRFYAYLYAMLGLGMICLAIALTISAISDDLFWPGGALFSGIYLLGSSALAFRGAREYQRDSLRASALLVVFFVAVIGFLMLFGGAVSVFVNQQHPSSGVLTVALLAVFVLFGVGSYLIELLYLFHEVQPTANQAMNADLLPPRDEE